MRRLRRSARWTLATALIGLTAFATWRYHQRVLSPEQVIGPAPVRAITPAYFRRVSVEATRMPFRDVIEQLTRQSDASIEVRWEELSPPVSDYPVTLLLRDVPLHDALDLAVWQMDVKPPPVVLAYADRVVITSLSQAGADVFEHTYNLRWLVDLFHVEEEPADPAASGGGGGGGSLFRPDPPPTRLDTCREMAEMIEELFAEHDWTNHEPRFSAINSDETVVVTATRALHAQFHQFLYDIWLSEVHGIERPRDPEPRRRQVLRALQQVRSMQEDEVSPEAWATKLQQASGVNMAIDTAGLNSGGIGSFRPILLEGAASAGELVLNRFGGAFIGSGRHRLRGLISLGVTAEGVVWVGDQIRTPRRLTRVYHVGDLMEEWLPAPRMPGLDAPDARWDFAPALQDLITSVVDPDDWRSSGGLVSSLSMFQTGRTMVVTAPLEVHDEVDHLLARHRRLRDLKRH